jgi:hypothetical protein
MPLEAKFAPRPAKVAGRVYPSDRPRVNCALGSGIRVVWNEDSLDPPVIPAKAGIQSDDSTFPKVCGVDSRFRGNDCAPNDTTT